MLPDLLNQIPADHDLGSVTADGAYDTRKCHDAIAARNAHALAIVLEPMAHKARSRRARTPRCGSLTHPEREHATKPSDPQSIWVAQCGDI